MSKIQKLTDQIASIEEEAGQLDEHDYEALYKLLAVAYFAAKDIIELQQENLPLVPETPSESSEDITALKEQIRVLEAWKYGANLEGEQHVVTIETLGDKLNTADHTIQFLSDKLNKIAELAK